MEDRKVKILSYLCLACTLYASFIACKPQLYTELDPEPDVFLLERDEASHHKNSLEWWYFTGHLNDSGQNKTFGMEYVLFHFSPTKLKSYAMVNLALSDPESPAFYYDHQLIPIKSNWKSQYPLNVSLDKQLEFKLKGAKGDFKLQAVMSNHDVQYNLETKPTKGIMLHDSSGYLSYGGITKAGYYSYPRLATQGTIILKNEVYQVSGDLWFDRQWNCSGVTDQNLAWDWFSIQFEDSNTELMMYRLYHKQDASIDIIGGTYFTESGEVIALQNEDISIAEKTYWFSHLSKKMYPSKWEIDIDKLNLSLEITPMFNEQELQLQFFKFKKFQYWEGMCRAIGIRDSTTLTGKAYVEMTNR